MKNKYKVKYHESKNDKNNVNILIHMVGAISAFNPSRMSTKLKKYPQIKSRFSEKGSIENS